MVRGHCFPATYGPYGHYGPYGRLRGNRTYDERGQEQRFPGIHVLQSFSGGGSCRGLYCAISVFSVFSVFSVSVRGNPAPTPPTPLMVCYLSSVGRIAKKVRQTTKGKVKNTGIGAIVIIVGRTELKSLTEDD